MASITRFIETRLKLQVNAAKSAVGRPWERSFLSFTMKDGQTVQRCVAPKAIDRFKNRMRELTGRSRGVSMVRVIEDLNPVLRGWAGYFGFSQWRELASLDAWVRRRLRCLVWVKWSTMRRRVGGLRHLGVTRSATIEAAISPKVSPAWRSSCAPRSSSAVSPWCSTVAACVAPGCAAARTSTSAT